MLTWITLRGAGGWVGGTAIVPPDRAGARRTSSGSGRRDADAGWDGVLADRTRRANGGDRRRGGLFPDGARCDARCWTPHPVDRLGLRCAHFPSRASTGRANPRPLARSCIGWSSANPNSRFSCCAGNTDAFKSLFRGSTLFTMIKWMRHKRIHTKLDGHHPEDRHPRRCARVDGGAAPARHAPAADVSTRGRPSIPWVLTFVRMTETERASCRTSWSRETGALRDLGFERFVGFA
jgi:hypothetical protein